jgi:hypothetical protein
MESRDPSKIQIQFESQVKWKFQMEFEKSGPFLFWRMKWKGEFNKTRLGSAVRFVRSVIEGVSVQIVLSAIFGLAEARLFP